MILISQYSNLNQGETYNHWTIIEYLGKSKHGKDIYKCRCNCDNQTIRDVEGRNLVLGKSKSCGCAKRVPKDIQKQNIKEYKAQYFQDNKEKIIKRNKERRKNEDKIVNINYHLKSKYNTTLEEIEAYYIIQQGKCFICNKNLKTSWIFGVRDNPKGSDTMCIDHNHKTGKVRGLLCFNCNIALGFFKDDIKSLKMAVKYLEMEEGNEKIS